MQKIAHYAAVAVALAAAGGTVIVGWQTKDGSLVAKGLYAAVGAIGITGSVHALDLIFTNVAKWKQPVEDVAAIAAKVVAQVAPQYSGIVSTGEKDLDTILDLLADAAKSQASPAAAPAATDVDAAKNLAKG